MEVFGCWQSVHGDWSIVSTHCMASISFSSGLSNLLRLLRPIQSSVISVVQLRRFFADFRLQSELEPPSGSPNYGPGDSPSCCLSRRHGGIIVQLIRRKIIKSVESSWYHGFTFCPVNLWCLSFIKSSPSSESCSSLHSAPNHQTKHSCLFALLLVVSFCSLLLVADTFAIHLFHADDNYSRWFYWSSNMFVLALSLAHAASPFYAGVPLAFEQ